jgi:histidine ammonia-lyase
MGEQSMTIVLNGSDLTVTQVVAAARRGEAVALAPASLETMRQARAVVQEALQARQPVYGLTTGVAERKSFLLDPAERLRFNRRLVLNHRVAQGDVAPAVAAQAIDLRAPGELGRGTARVHGMIRELVPFTQADGTLPADLEPLVDLIRRGDLEPA